MTNLTIAFWVSLGLVSLISTLMMRLSIRLFAKKADNGWDNAVGYVLVSGLILYFPVRWMLGSGSWALIALAPMLTWIVQTLTVKVFYEVSTFHAWLLGVVHTLATTFVTTTIAFGVGVVLAYILYGQII